MNSSPYIKKGKGNHLFSASGTKYLDLINGFGSVFLGHCDEAIAKSAHAQIDQLWITARLPSDSADHAKEAVQTLLPKELSEVQFYSTGMEAIEFSLRLAAAQTRREQFVGFENSMHGKSVATSSLSWSNKLIGCNNCLRIPFPTVENEPQVMQQLGKILLSNSCAAVILEPLQGSWNGDCVSNDFIIQLISLCKRTGTLCIFDETLTGLYRTGQKFFFSSMPLVPDILIFAKALGNGFPVSAVATSLPKETILKAMPGSTFSGAPLACAIVTETINQFQQRISSSLIKNVEDIITHAFHNLATNDFQLKGLGAVWILSLDSPDKATQVQNTALDNGVLVSKFGANIRLLPQAEIDLNALDRALYLIAKSL